MHVEADVCVVGGGPAGMTTAAGCAAAGLRTVLVEAGDPHPPSGGAPLDTARSVGLPYPLQASRARGLGGSALRWDIETPVGAPYVRLRELDDLDFRGPGGAPLPGWPLSPADLAPHYARAWRLFGLERPQPAPRTSTGLLAADFAFGPAAAVTRDLRDALLRHPLVRVLPRTWVTEVLVEDERAAEVSSLAVRSGDGSVGRVRAHAYVLACGGIENARLLLASRSPQHPDGVGNAHDLVGRSFMEHPHYDSGVVVPRRGGPAVDHRAHGYRTEGGRVLVRHHLLPPEVVAEERLVSAAYYLLPRARTAPVVLRPDGTVDAPATNAAAALRLAVQGHRVQDLGGSLRGALVRAPAVVRQLARSLMTGHAAGSLRPLTVKAMADQQPAPDSRVRLGRERDARGVPLALLDWRLTEHDRWSMTRGQELLQGPLAAEVGGDVHSLLGAEVPELGVGYHHMGTTRMSRDPRVGVVDVECLVHGMANLFVSGSSVFATGGTANPSLTVIALADRLADHLAVRLGHRPRPRQDVVSG